MGVANPFPDRVVGIFHTFYDMLYKRKKKSESRKYSRRVIKFIKMVRWYLTKVRKGTWRMPWLSEAMKDVISCEKPRSGANSL